MASVFTINLSTGTYSFANGFSRVVIIIWYVVVAISNSQVSARMRMLKMMMMMTTILNADVVDVAIRW